MKVRRNSVLIMLSGVLLAGCATTGMTNAQKDTAIGAGTGAVVGAILARATGHDAAVGAALGGAGGGVLGYFYGKSVDLEEAEKLKKASIDAGQQSAIQTQIITDSKTNEKKSVFQSQEIKIKNSDLESNNPKVVQLLSLTEKIAKDESIQKIDIAGDMTIIKNKVLPQLSDVDKTKIKMINQKGSAVMIKLTAEKIQEVKS